MTLAMWKRYKRGAARERESVRVVEANRKKRDNVKTLVGIGG